MSSDPTMTFPATHAPPGSQPPPPPPPAGRPVERRPSRDSLVVAIWSLLLAVVAFAPLLASRGVALRGDMVFVPRQPLKGAWLGLDGWVAGAVPADFLVALGTVVAPGDLLQKVALVVIVVLAGTGAGALLSDLSVVARLAAATFYIWNPFVYERLLVGDWTFLVGYACLPWIAWAARRVTTGSIGEVAPVVVFLAIAGWTSPVGGVLGLVLAVLVLARRNGRAALVVLLAGIVVNLPWIIPGLFRPGGPTGSAESVEAFAVNAETPLGVIGSALTLGGVWDSAAYVPGRDNIVVALVALLLTLAALAGTALAARRWDAGTVGAIAVLAVIGLVIALLGGLEATRSLIESLADDVPGGAVLADGHVWLAPLALLLAVGFGALAGLVATEVGERAGGGLVALIGLVAVAIPIALLPSLALGLGGELDDARYPGDWWTARQVLEERDAAGVLVLPFTAEREYEWNDQRWSVDAARNYFPGDFVTEDQRVVNGVTVPGTDPRAEAIRESLEGNPDDFLATLADNGIDHVLIERNVAGPGAPNVELGERVHRGGQLVVFALPDDVTAADVDLDAPPSLLVIVADVLAALVALGAVAAWVALGRTRRTEVV